MNRETCSNYEEMSLRGALEIHACVAPRLAAGKNVNLGLATGNTMVNLYRYLAELWNRERLDLSRLQTWNLDEYAFADGTPVPHDHPLSYWKYMHEHLFSRFAPERNFHEQQAHFPSPADPASFDRALELAGGLDFQLLGLGFNGHIAFNEPRSPKDISTADYATLPSRLLRLDPRTVEQNRVLTAGGDASLVPPCAATMGMKQILAAKRCLLLCCFAEQSAPLKKVLELREPTPELPGSFLAFHPDCRAIYTTDLVHPF